MVRKPLVVRKDLLGGMQKHFKTKNTVKPDLTTTCEQRPHVNNRQFEPSTTSLNLSFIRQLCQTATFSGPKGGRCTQVRLYTKNIPIGTPTLIRWYAKQVVT